MSIVYLEIRYCILSDFQIYFVWQGGVIMPDYEKLYHLLFNTITDALRRIEAGSLDAARFLLIRAQQEAEEIYIKAGECASLSVCDQAGRYIVYN